MFQNGLILNIDFFVQMSRLQICTHWLVTKTLQVADQIPSRILFFANIFKICFRLPDESQRGELPQLPLLLLEPIFSWRPRLDACRKSCRGHKWKSISFRVSTYYRIHIYIHIHIYNSSFVEHLCMVISVTRRIGVIFLSVKRP